MLLAAEIPLKVVECCLLLLLGGVLFSIAVSGLALRSLVALVGGVCALRCICGLCGLCVAVRCVGGFVVEIKAKLKEDPETFFLFFFFFQYT